MTSVKQSFSYQRYENVPSDEINVKPSGKYSRPHLLGFLLTFFGVVMLLALSALTRPSVEEDTLGNTTPFRSVAHPETPTIYWGVVQKPYPTGAFWTNLVVDNGDGIIGLYPYGIRTVDTGVQVSYGAFRRQVSHAAINDYYGIDLEISSVESYRSRAVSAHTNLSVSMTYQVAGGSFTTHLVKSSPFVTVVYSGATPVIRSSLMLILSVEPRVVQNSTGVQYLVTLGNFEKWLVYSSEPVELRWVGNALISATPFTGFIRVAVLPLRSVEASFSLLMKYVNKYPTGGSLTFHYEGEDTATVEYQYSSEGSSGSLLMLALPHHLPLLQWPSLSEEEQVEAYSAYTPLYCIKGRMRPVIGDSWRLVYPLVAVGWNYVISDVLSTSQLNTIVTHLMLDVNTVQPNAEDPYTFGKQAGRMATIALLADSLSIAEVRQTALTNLEMAMVPWILSEAPDSLLYDVTYGGVVTTNGVVSSQAEFGSGWYNDHHFHYGYFTFAAAVLAKLNPDFFLKYQSFFDSLLRDYCNSNTNSQSGFPFVRHKDFFDGHSWASGLFQLGNGKNQESSSEAVNAYYGAYLYGLASNNADLAGFSRLLLSMEIHSAKAYWHMQTAATSPSSTSSTDLIYDAIFASTYMVGNIGATDATTSTWFGSDLKFVHGINMMPLSPVTAVLFDAPFVRNQYPVLATSIPNATMPHPDCSANPFCAAAGLVGDCCPTLESNYLACCDGPMASQVQVEFTSYAYIDLAVIDRELAWQKILTQTTFGDGNSRANSLYWAASRAAPSVTPTQLVLGRNVSDYAAEVLPSCQANAACDVLGLQGLCCPTAAGVTLGCCPKVH